MSERRRARSGRPHGADGRGGPAQRRATAPAPERASSADVLVLPPGVLRQIREESRAAWPGEGCGVLVGRVTPGRREVERAVPAANRWGERKDRYRVDPDVLRRLLEEEDAGGARVLGFWHSHPDHPPVPSETDRAHAWPWYHYLIVPTSDSGSGAPRGWELEGDDGGFAEREVVEREVVEREVRRAGEPAREG